jgi:hypothetical protein
MGVAIGRVGRFLEVIRERRCHDCVRESYDREFDPVLVDQCSMSQRTEQYEVKQDKLTSILTIGGEDAPHIPRCLLLGALKVPRSNYRSRCVKGRTKTQDPLNYGLELEFLIQRIFVPVFPIVWNKRWRKYQGMRIIL